MFLQTLLEDPSVDPADLQRRSETVRKGESEAIWSTYVEGVQNLLTETVAHVRIEPIRLFYTRFSERVPPPESYSEKDLESYVESLYNHRVNKKALLESVPSTYLHRLLEQIDIRFKQKLSCLSELFGIISDKEKIPAISTSSSIIAMIDNVIKQSMIITIEDIERLQEKYRMNKEIVDVIEMNKAPKREQMQKLQQRQQLLEMQHQAQIQQFQSLIGGRTPRSYRKHTKRSQKNRK
jgi:hypothetical protein